MSRRHARLGIAAVIAAGALVLAPLVPAVAQTVVVSSVDFDDGTTGDWTQSGGADGTLSVVDDPDGGRMLRVNDRSADYVGLQSPTGILAPGETYAFSMVARLADGVAGSAGVRFVLKPAYNWIGNTTMTATEWTTVAGEFTVPADADPASLQVYIGTADLSPAAPYSYLVDDIRITREDDTIPGVETLLSNDFEGDSVAPWGPRGSVTLATTDAAAHSGSRSLSVTGRTADWNGPATDALALFTPGIESTVSAWVRLPAGTTGSSGIHFTVQETNAGGTDAYTWVGGSIQTTADGWTQIGGTYTLPADLTAASLYIEAAPIGDVNPSFLVDDVLITAPDDDPGTGPEPGTIVIDTDFEDGLDGWGPRDGGGGAPTIELSTLAHGGAQSAAVTNRLDQGAGIGHDVLGLLESGTQYEVTAWVRFAAGTPGDELWLSLQRDSSFQTLGQFTGITEDGWTQVTATFSMGAAETTALLYFETPYDGGAIGDTSSFLVDDIVVRVPEPAVIQDLTPIKDTTTFPVGVAIDTRETTGSASELLLRHFDQITPENHMKPEAWYTDDEAHTFRAHPDADALMAFAAENDLHVYGHVLVWHSQTPAWFFQNDAGVPLTTSEADKQFLRDRLRGHIFNIAEHLSTGFGEFGGGNPLVAFDVVNEVIADSGDFADGMRRSEWYRILGEEFVDLAFRYADEAFNDVYAADGSDRPVTLFINDYNTEQSGKQGRYHALVERLIARGVPVDGVGHQFHVNLSMPVSALEDAIVAFEDLPVTQAVTEFDVPTGTPVSQALLVEQGYYFRDAFRAFREHADDLFHVTVWGLTDGRSWRSANGAPLIFNDGYQAKPAYYGVVDGELPAPLRTANVFAGDVALTPDAAAALEWKQLPLHPIEDVADFQLRWAADHLTAYVSVDDADAEAGDGVEFALGEAVFAVDRHGTGDADAVVTERSGGYDVVAHLPASIVIGTTTGFDARVTDGTVTTSWNAPGVLGTLSFVEPLSYLEVQATASAPVIDAAADDVWDDANAVTTSKQVQGADGAIATVRTLWKDQMLYVLAEVADPVVDVSGSDPWIQDSVEIYVDPGNAKNGSYRYDDTQIRISAENAVSFGTGDETFQRNRVQSATARVDGGYVVEAAISLLEYGGEGTFHGLDFQVNDAAGGARSAITNWADPTGLGYQSTARWGVGQLVAPVDPRAESTVVGVPDSVVAKANKKLKYTVTVTASERPTGEVTVFDGATPIATATLERKDHGTVTIQLPRLSTGLHQLSVEYSGSDLVQGSVSAPVSVSIL